MNSYPGCFSSLIKLVREIWSLPDHVRPSRHTWPESLPMGKWLRELGSRSPKPMFYSSCHGRGVLEGCGQGGGSTLSKMSVIGTFLSFSIYSSSSSPLPLPPPLPLLLCKPSEGNTEAKGTICRFLQCFLGHSASPC